MSTPTANHPKIITPNESLHPFRTDDRERILSAFSIFTSLIFGGCFIGLISGYTSLPVFKQNLLHYLGLLVVFFIPTVLGVVCSTSDPIKSVTTRSILLTVSVQVALIAHSMILEGLAIPAGLIILLYTIIVSFSTLPKAQTDLAVNGGSGTAIAAVLVGVFSPIQQIEVPTFQLIAPAIVGIMVMTYIVLLVMEFIPATLRIKIVSAVLAIVIIPLALLAVLQTSFTRSALQSQNDEALKLAANQTTISIDNFISDTLYSTTIYATLPVFTEYIKTPTELRQTGRVFPSLISTVGSIQKSQHLAYLESIGVLDIKGNNIYDTDAGSMGLSEAGEKYFDVTSLTGSPYISTIRLPDNADANFVFSAPIRDESQKLIGVLRLRYNALIFQRLAANNIGLFGEQSFPIIIDDQYVRIADTVNPPYIFKPIIQLSEHSIQQLKSNKRLQSSYSSNQDTYIPAILNAIQNMDRKNYFTTDIAGMDPEYPEIGVIVRFKHVPWYLIYVQEQGQLYAVQERQNQLALIISTIVAGAVSFFATVMARILSNPIIKLTETAQIIAAGNINQEATVESGDEVGTLANTFNIMTARLRHFISELEDRVNIRTQELAKQNEFLVFRARQLQTISDVARDVASAQELEKLLPHITQLISERFNFYHVGIFLLDEAKEYAVLRAANSEGGQRMLKRQHRLRVGQVGIVGYVSSSGKPRIATDVGEDSVFFNNPDLPLTRSEMALPLEVGEQIIGALDVQSTTSGAFTQEDIELFSILADQIAIAITNNRLLEESNQALEEISELHRAYLRKEWNRQVKQQIDTGFRYTTQGTVVQEKTLQPEIRKVVDTGEAIIQDSQTSPDGVSTPAKIAVPIMLRGEPIGVIHLEEQGKEARSWAENELLAVQTVADQIALALENARLFQETIRRAERERKALEITSKIRSTNDFQTIIQVAVEELQQALNASRAQVILRRSETPDSSSPSGNGQKSGRTDKLS